MEVGNYVSAQLLLFLRSIALGLCLGLLYDLLGALRKLGGKLWGGVLDAVFCLTAAVAVLFFVLAGDGELRIFVALGILGGAVLFWCLLSGILRPVWTFWLDMLLLPFRLLWRFAKKCGQFMKKIVAFLRKWFIIRFTHLFGHKKRPPQEGEEEMSKPTEKKAASRKKRGTTRPAGKLTMLLLAVLIVALGAQIYRMVGQLQVARTEEAAYTRQLNELRDANQQLREDLANSEDLDLIEDIARDQLGMVRPGEKVFHFSK